MAEEAEKNSSFFQGRVGLEDEGNVLECVISDDLTEFLDMLY